MVVVAAVVGSSPVTQARTTHTKITLQSHKPYTGLMLPIAWATSTYKNIVDSCSIRQIEGSSYQIITLTNREYASYLLYQAAKSSSVASVAYSNNLISNPTICFTPSSSSNPWILDSKAFDHISGNKEHYSSLMIIFFFQLLRWLMVPKLLQKVLV